jgi:uncharacterized membrane protein YczE
VLPTPAASELRRRLPRLAVGLVAFGGGIGLMVLSGLGLPPWDVLHQGLSERTGVPIGTAGIFVGLALLLLWIPLRQRVGIGTLSNAVVVGLVIDGVVWAVPEPSHLLVRWALLVAGIALIGLGSGAYIGAGLGPGPRDGLMTGIAARGPSVRLVRTAIEVTVLALGIVLGGTAGVGTVLLALLIGPIVQVTLGWFDLGTGAVATDVDPLAPEPAR